MEALKKYFWIIFFGTLIGYSIYLFGYLHLIKGKSIDEVLGPKKDMYAILTETSANCVNCHGKKEIRGAKLVKSAWGVSRWEGYEATYIDPHVNIKIFNKIKISKKIPFEAVSVANAGQYDGLGNHPVGVPYPRFDNGYRNPPVAPISLPNGYVECESCHLAVTANTPNHGDLVMDNKGSALCLGCHIK